MKTKTLMEINYKESAETPETKWTEPMNG
jgi:hypothetical protein